jgi:L-Ala-D/L-Glu epimerase
VDDPFSGPERNGDRLLPAARPGLGVQEVG